ncbi:MAG: GPW/gp25 family protein [Clostridiales bacterium]|nr:GPW/gp25 family protein [Clostridiales bacterium]
MSAHKDREHNIGLAFPLQVGEDGRLAACSEEAHIRQSLRTLLLTARGERVMRPEFGSRVGAYLYENIGATTAALIKNEVKSTVERFEPRVELIDVAVNGGARDVAVLSVEVRYRIKSTGAADRLAVDVRR